MIIFLNIFHCFVNFFVVVVELGEIVILVNFPLLDTRLSVLCLSVPLMVPPLNSGTVWNGDFCRKTLLKKNIKRKHFFVAY